jgi:WD40 repeat protein
VEARITLLLEYLRERHGLLVLDNLETILQPGVREGHYLPGYEGYGAVFRRLGEAGHRSCLVVTSREKPLEVGLLEGEGAPVRSLRMPGLGTEEGRALLRNKGLVGDMAAWQAMISRYGGNALALRIVGESIAEVFDGEIAAFLEYAQETYGAVFGGIRRLLDEQTNRLSDLERSLFYWLAVEREPVGLGDLLSDLGPATVRSDVLEALEALRRRSLLERGERGATVTLQPVVLEYATERLIQAVAAEIGAGQPALLVSHAMLLARAKDYVRRSQERLIAQPLVERLVDSLGDPAAVVRHLLNLLQTWRDRPHVDQGYVPGNVINLVRLANGHLCGLDLSRLAIKQAYLQGIEMHDTSLTQSHLSQSVVAESVHSIMALALNANDLQLAVADARDRVLVWRLPERTPILQMQGEFVLKQFGVGLGMAGSTLVCTGPGGLIYVWDTHSGKRLPDLAGHTGIVYAVALSADARRAASGSHDGTVRIWDVLHARCLAILTGHTGAVTSVALSADGRLVASGGYDGTVRLWEAGSGRPLAVLVGHAGWVLTVAISADGSLIASGGQDGTVRLWTTPQEYGEQVGAPLQGAEGGDAILQGHHGLVWTVALGSNGQSLVSGGSDGTVRIWDTSRGDCLDILREHVGVVHGIALSSDGKLAASGGLDGVIRLWELGWPASPSRCVATLQGSGEWWDCTALTPDGRLVAASSSEGVIRLWDTGSGRLCDTILAHSNVWGMALSANGQLLLSSGREGAVKLWDLASGQAVVILEGLPEAVRGVALTRDGKLAAFGWSDSTVQLCHVGRPHAIRVLAGHEDIVYRLAFSADGRLLASASHDGTVRLWDTTNEECVAVLRGHEGFAYGLAMSADGQLVASGGQDGTVRLWDGPGAHLLDVLESKAGEVLAVALSAEGTRLACGTHDGSVILWQVPKEGSPVQRMATQREHAGLVRDIAMSADGLLFASSGLDSTLRLWDGCTGSLLRTLRRDRLYERMDITGLTGVTEVQRAALRDLGAVETSIPFERSRRIQSP